MLKVILLIVQEPDRIGDMSGHLQTLSHGLKLLLMFTTLVLMLVLRQFKVFQNTSVLQERDSHLKLPLLLVT